MSLAEQQLGQGAITSESLPTRFPDAVIIEAPEKVDLRPTPPTVKTWQTTPVLFISTHSYQTEITNRQ